MQQCQNVRPRASESAGLLWEPFDDGLATPKSDAEPRRA